MNVLVDTSVWVRFLANRTPFAGELAELLRHRAVRGHDMIYGELLMGDTGSRRRLLADYRHMHQAPVVAHAEVAAFVRDRGLAGRGIGWIDAHLLAAALAGRLHFWTADTRLAALASQLGVGHAAGGLEEGPGRHSSS